MFSDVPAGSYQLKVSHETLGEVKEDTIVNPGADMHVSFELMTK